MKRAANLGMRAGLLVLALLGACSEARQRSEAKAFLAQYETLDHRAPAATREQKLRGLEQLVITDNDVKRARDDCVSAHRALLGAERAHEQAARQLDVAIAKKPGGEALSAAETNIIRYTIEQADKSLTDARARFTRCESEARGLSLRFGKS